MDTQFKSPDMQDTEKGQTTYTAAGHEVTLSFDIVRKLLVKGGGEVTNNEIVAFIYICKFNSLNPFLNEAYLIKYGKDVQMVVSKEALMKRAESSPEYEGLRAGLIVKRGDALFDVEGSFFLPTDVLLGAWAEVYRKDRKFPCVARVPLDEYNTGKSTWLNKKATMIRKVAIVQALREAFPAQLGAMYTAEEQNVVHDVPFEDVSEKVDAEIAEKANAGEMIGFANAQPNVQQIKAPF
jgi:phage recombination protein Bet